MPGECGFVERDGFARTVDPQLGPRVRRRATSPRTAIYRQMQMSSPGESAPTVFRIGGVSYVRIPADDARRLATFYEAVFGWTVRTDRDEPSFADGSGHVIGHFTADQAVAGEAGGCGP